MSKLIFQTGLLQIVLILLFISADLKAQSFFDVFGVNEFSTGVLKYDTTNDIASGYIMRSALGQIPITDSNTLLYRVEWDNKLQLVGTNLLETPSINPYHYNGIREIDNWDNKILAYTIDPTNLGSVRDFFPYASNCYLCDLANDSLKNCIQLLPDSAFNFDVLGVYNDIDTIHLIASYALGSGDTLPKVHHVRIAKSTLAISSKVPHFFKNGIDYYLFGNPIKLPNGNWFVRLARDSAQVSGGSLYSVVDNGLNNIVSLLPAGSPFSSFTKTWVIKDKVVFVHTENPNVATWLPSDPIRETLALIEYDWKNDSVTNRHYYKVSSDTSKKYHYTSGYSAFYNGHYFVLAAQRAGSFSHDPLPKATIIAVVDTSYNLAGQLLLEDTIQAVTPMLDAVINGIAQGANPKEFYYMGYIQDPDVNTGNYTYDIMLGKLDLNNIGTEEYIKVRHQKTWLYPNPTNGKFKLTNTAVPFKPYQYKVFDVTGKLVLSGQADSQKQAVEVNLTSGTYYLSTEHGDVLPFVVE